MTSPLSLACAVGVIIVSVDGGVRSDPCVEAIPRTLRLAAAKSFPGYQPPRGTDARLATADETSRDKCTAVARGDFNGDRHEDYGLLLTADNDSAAVLAVALRVGENWRLESLRSFKKTDLVNLYVTTVPPGTYGSKDGAAEPLEPSEKRSFRSKRAGIVTGTLEASAIGYFWTPQGWIHVWISN